MRDGGAAIFVAEDQEYVDKILPIADRLPALALDRRDRRLRDVRLRRIRSCERYDALLAARASEADARLARAALAATARPDATRLHRLHLGHHRPSQGRAGRARQASRRHREPRRALSDARANDASHGRLPAAVPHPRPRRRGHAAADLAAGAALRRGPGGPRRDAVRGRADRAVHRAALPAEVRLAGAGRHRQLARRCKRAAVRSGDARRARPRARALGRQARPARERRSTRACRAGVFRPILNKLGLDQLELVISGGAPLPPETMALWQIWGVNVVRDLRPDREPPAPSSPASAARFRGPATSAPSPPGWRGRSSPTTAKSWCASPDLFDGYWNNAGCDARDARARTAGCAPATSANGATASCGWSTARATSSSPPAARRSRPRSSRTSLRASPYVAEAMVFGHGRKYLTALIEIDYDTVADWARSHDVAYTGFTSLAQQPATWRG